MDKGYVDKAENDEGTQNAKRMWNLQSVKFYFAASNIIAKFVHH